MDSVFETFATDIKSVADEAFLRYIRDEILNPVACAVLDDVLSLTNVYVFSGVTRDYFLERRVAARDIDLVVADEIDWRALYRKYRGVMSVAINSYGGFKVAIGNLRADVWTMHRTWGLVRKGVGATPRNLIRTAFFNFSAVAYLLNRRRFYVHRAFAHFLRSREIDVLYKENPNAALCIVNALYYSRLLRMPLSRELREWIVRHYNIFDDYDAVQISHWGNVRYSRHEIHLFVSQCQQP